MREIVLVLVVLLLGGGVGCDAPGDAPVDSGITVAPDAPSPAGQPDAAAPPPGAGAPGSACDCDADCAAVDGHAGTCVFGVCMTRASSECSAAGSSAECPAGSRCWGLEGHAGSLCWPDCDGVACAGDCDGDGSCVPTGNTECDYACGDYCSCTDGDCPEGEQCVSGMCIQGAGDGPGAGPGPACNLPERECAGPQCGNLVVFDPRTTADYDDYPINGETAGNQYRSYLRRDLMMLVRYATAKVSCKAAGWTSGIGGALGLGDMSEANGAIPGTAIGSPAHPAGSHVNGYDIDLAYYQTGTPDNRLRPICAHTNPNGSDAYHCTAEPHRLDVWRTALFLGALFESPRIRVIGVDGKAGPALLAALDTLCKQGWVEPSACSNIILGFEETNTGLGWFHFHHHHAHISLKKAGLGVEAAPCLTGDCGALPYKRHPKLLAPR